MIAISHMPADFTSPDAQTAGLPRELFGRALWRFTIALTLAALSPSLNYAESGEDELAAIRAQLELQDQQIQELRARLAAPPTPTPSVQPAALEGFVPLFGENLPGDGVPQYLAAAPETLPNAAAKPLEGEPQQEMLKAVKKDEKPPFPTFRIVGFTHLDGGLYGQSDSSRATFGDAQDGLGFRRARLGVAGSVAEFTNYMLEMDFATAGRPSFFDVYVEQWNLPYLGTVRVGQYVQYFSVDSMTSFRTLPFLERALPFIAFVPFRRLGVEAFNHSEDLMTQWGYGLYRVGGFNNAPLGDDRFATDFGDVGGYGFTGRMSHLLHYDQPTNGRYLLAVGGSYSYAQLGANDAVGSGLPGNAGSPRPFYQSRVIPEFGTLGYPELSQTFGSAVNGTPIVADTGRYEAENFNLFGVEAVWQGGPWSFQTEWIGSLVESVVGPVFYNGAYAEVMYRLTGEHRVYDQKLGVLKNPEPFEEFFSLRPGGICGWGAWEVAGRWSFVNLRNPAALDGHYYNSATNTFTATSRAGNGTVNDLTAGLTWFLNARFKLQFNYIHSMVDNVARGDQTLDVYATRVQVEF